MKAILYVISTLTCFIMLIESLVLAHRHKYDVATYVMTLTIFVWILFMEMKTND
jgi:hypothetical protein